MTRIVGEVTINAPVSLVFDVVADERNEPKYNPRMDTVEKLSSGPIGSGAEFAVTPKGMRSNGPMIVRTLEYERPRRLRNQVRSAYMKADGTLTFTPEDGKTRLRWDWETSLQGPMRLLLPLLVLLGPRWERRNWIGLKMLLESDGHRGPAN